jgi:NhaP-type Na+/H+ or K+/H+ antiporter
MLILITFAVTLFLAVLVSELARRSILSTAVLFLVAGMLTELYPSSRASLPGPKLIQDIAEITLFAVLFSDGMRLGGIKDFYKRWRLPVRALLFGMPLTILGIALIGRYLANLDWDHALLFGAALSPTDPVFISAIFSIEEVPSRLKALLSVESGLNDGLALPAVLLLIAGVKNQHSGYLSILWELFIGGVIGIALPWAAIKLEQSRFFSASGIFQSLFGFSIALLVYAACLVSGANLFIAAFLAGITTVLVGPRSREELGDFNELIAELAKLIALFLLGLAAAKRILEPLPPSEYIAIVLAVFAVRPVAILVSMLRTPLSLKERLAAGWFGPKGFASVVYGVMILRVDGHLAHMVGLAVIASIVIYSSTDIFIGRAFPKKPTEQDVQRAA